MSRGWQAVGVVAVVVLLSTMVAGCGSESGGSAGGATTLTVSAASSLTDAFGELAEDFERDHPEVEVALNLDSSSTLATQIVQGAPVDVFASADDRNMAEVAEAGLVAGDPSTFATNDIVVVTRPGNPTGVEDLTGVAELARSGEVVALCAADAPCGHLADAALTAAGVDLPEGQVTRAQNARATLSAVATGDAAAAIVYASDARSAGDEVDTVMLTGAAALSTAYQIAVLRDAPAGTDLASEFVDLVLSPPGMAVLQTAGLRPTESS